MPELIETRLDAIRTDPTAHRLRLEAMLPPLIGEFGESRPAREIRACADAVLAEYDDVPVRGHVQAIAHQRTRLQADRCAELQGSG